MIIPRLWARLGNQCFQIAAAVAHANTMRTDWAIPNATLDMRLWPNYFLPIVGQRHVVHANRKLRSHYKEPRHCYDPLPESNDMTIEGYFQSEKYFADAKPQIQMALNFFAQPSDFVAVHVRRGDYLQYPDQFPVLDTWYTRNAISEAMTNGYGKFKIYSDDIGWCKNHFLFERKYYYKAIELQFCEIKDPLNAMRDMYNAAAFIISNSTFSLFPATLRPDNPLVIAPKEDRWYGPANKHLQTCDLMPERFIKI